MAVNVGTLQAFLDIDYSGVSTALQQLNNDLKQIGASFTAEISKTLDVMEPVVQGLERMSENLTPVTQALSEFGNVSDAVMYATDNLTSSVEQANEKIGELTVTAAQLTAGERYTSIFVASTKDALQKVSSAAQAITKSYKQSREEVEKSIQAATADAAATREVSGAKLVLSNAVNKATENLKVLGASLLGVQRTSKRTAQTMKANFTEFWDYAQKMAVGILLSQISFKILMAVREAGNALIEFRRNIEGATFALAVMSRDADDARASISDLMLAAAQLRISPTTIIQSASHLRRLKVEAEMTAKMLEVTADATAMAGSDPKVFTQIIEAFGMLSGRAYLTTRGLQRMQSAGVPAFSAIQHELKLTNEQMKDLSSLMIPSEVGIKAIMKHMERLYGGAAQAAATLPAIMQSIGSNLLFLGDTLSAGIRAQFRTFLAGVSETLTAAVEAYTKFGMGGLLQTIVPPHLLDTVKRLMLAVRGFAHSIAELMQTLKPVTQVLRSEFLEVLTTVAQVLSGIISSVSTFVRGLIEAIPPMRGLARALSGLLIVSLVIKVFGILIGAVQYTVRVMQPAIRIMQRLARAIIGVRAASGRSSDAIMVFGRSITGLAKHVLVVANTAFKIFGDTLAGSISLIRLAAQGFVSIISLLPSLVFGFNTSIGAVKLFVAELYSASRISAILHGIIGAVANAVTWFRNLATVQMFVTAVTMRLAQAKIFLTRIAQVAGGAISKAFSSIIKFAQPAIAAVSAVIQPVIALTMRVIQLHAANLLGSIKSIGAVLAVVAVVGLLVAAFKPLRSAISDIWGSFKDMMGFGATEAFDPKPVEQVTTAYTDLGKRAGDALEDAGEGAEEFGDSILGAAEKAKQGSKLAFDELYQLTKASEDAFSPDFEDDFEYPEIPEFDADKLFGADLARDFNLPEIGFNLSTIVDRLKQGWKEITDLFSGGWPAIKEAFSENWTTFTNFVGEKLPLLWDGIKRFFSGTFKFLGDMFSDLWLFLKRVWPELLENISTFITNFDISMITNGIKRIFEPERFADVLTGIIVWLSKAIVEVLGAVGKLAVSLASISLQLIIKMASETFALVMRSIGMVAGNLISSIPTLVLEAVGWVTQGFLNLAKNILEGIAWVANAVGLSGITEWAEGALANVQEAQEKATKNTEESVEKIRSAITTSVNKMADSAATKVQQAGTSMSGFVGRTSVDIVNLIDTGVTNLTGLADDSEEAIHSFTYNMADSMGKTLDTLGGVHEEMRDLSVDTTELMAGDIAEYALTVEGTYGDMLESGTDTFGDLLDVAKTNINETGKAFTDEFSSDAMRDRYAPIGTQLVDVFDKSKPLLQRALESVGKLIGEWAERILSPVVRMFDKITNKDGSFKNIPVQTYTVIQSPQAQMAAGGVALGRKVVEVAEAGRQEAIIPLSEQSLRPFASVLAQIIEERNAGMGKTEVSPTNVFNIGALIGDDHSLKLLERKLYRIRAEERYRKGGV